MVAIPKKLICKCKGYAECEACKTGRETGQRVFDSSREYDEYVAGLNSGQPLCPKCGSGMLRTETFRLKCQRCDALEVIKRAMTMVPTGLNSGQPECTDWQQKEYRVTWCIDVSADSPEDAVHQVWEQFFQRGHTATIFEVQESGEPDSEMIDVESPL